MSELYLTNVTIACPSDGHHDIPDDARLFIDVFVDDDKVMTTRWLAKESTGRSWRLPMDEYLEVSYSVPSTRLIVMVEYSTHNVHQVGFTELTDNDLLAQYLNHKSVRPLIQTNNDLSLTLSYCCFVIPPEVPIYPVEFFEDADDRQAFMSQVALARSHNHAIGDHDVLRMFCNFKFQRALHLSDENPEKPVRLNLVGGMTHQLYGMSHENTDLERAIAICKAAVTITPDGHQCQAELHRHLGISLLDRFNHSGDVDDIENAIFSLQASVLLTPDGHKNKPSILGSLSTSFTTRFERFARLVDIDNAISADEHALHLVPNGHAAKFMLLSNLGASFLHRFKKSGHLAELDKAIFNQEQALHLAPDGDANKAACLNNLGVSFSSRFDRTEVLVDLDNAIFHHEQAVNLTPNDHPNKPAYLDNLASSFRRRFERSGYLVDIDNAISNGRQLVHLTPDGHAARPAHLVSLGISFFLRSRHYEDLVNIDNAISNHEQAVHLTPDDHPNKAGYLYYLGTSFCLRFERSGDLVNIDNAISNHNQAVHLTPDGNAARPVRLAGLGIAFFFRFGRSGDLVDINNAISNQEQVVHLTLNSDSAKPGFLNNLASSFLYRHGHSRDLADIDYAIFNHKQAVDLTADGHSAKPGRLSNLGNSFSSRFFNTGDIVDIDNAITNHKQALHLAPNNHAVKPICLASLGGSFLQRFKHSGDLMDLDYAISNYEQAVHFTPDFHSAKPIRLRQLGDSLSLRFEHSRDLADCHKAILHFSHAAMSSTGPPSDRFGAALKWARLARLDDSSALQGYAVALNLLPQVAWLGQTITARHKELSSIGDIANEAAAASISAEQYDTALEWLEQGRSIVWSQLHHLRTPVDALHEVQPSLADDLIRVSKALEQASSRAVDIEDSSMQSGQQLSIEEIAQSHRRLAEEWDILVKRAREITGFEDFLQPKKFAQLRRAADPGPVVVVNIHKHRCDALILMVDLDEVMHIPLGRFSYERARELHLALNRLLSNSGVRARETRTMIRVRIGTGTDFPSILSDLWSYVVKPVLDGLALTASCTVDPPRIWWCATGPLAFLPIHAAGIYESGVAGCTISEYVVSSYTPTLNTLIKATEHRETRRKFQGLLGISQPNTPGQFAIPNTTVELAQIQNRARDFAVHSLEGSAASVESVVKGMEAHSWVHLACHAVQERAKPTKSALCLDDGRLELSTIITKSFPHADFAFLSACQTATGDEELSEEAVHLAAGLMLAGYRSVIATMWSIKDEDAPVVADHVYSNLFSNAEPDSTKAALALHDAIKLLRQQTGDSAFLSWVPFIHLGI